MTSAGGNTAMATGHLLLLVVRLLVLMLLLGVGESAAGGGLLPTREGELRLPHETGRSQRSSRQRHTVPEAHTSVWFVQQREEARGEVICLHAHTKTNLHPGTQAQQRVCGAVLWAGFPGRE